MVQPNTLIQSIAPSATMAITAKAKAMKKEGIDVVSFGAGEPDFDTPEFIRTAAIEAINAGETRYTAGQGTVELRTAVAKRWSADYQLEYNPDQVVVSTGAKQSIYNLLNTVIEPGDEVIVPAPYWVSYPDMIKLARGVPKEVFCGQDQGFCLTAEQLRDAIGPKTKGIMLNNPSNPTGGAYSRAQLEALAEVIVEHDLWVISDEIYDKLIFGDHRHTPFASLGEEVYSRTATVNGVSKAYAMTGWRIGYAAGPEQWLKACGKLQSQCTSNASSVSQAAALAAISGDQSVIETMREAFDARRKLIVSLLRDIDGIECAEPKGAFYVFPNISKVLGPYKDALEWAGAILEQQKVALVPGDPFGAPGHMRLSYATSETQIRDGLARIERFVAGLK